MKVREIHFCSFAGAWNPCAGKVIWMGQSQSNSSSNAAVCCGDSRRDKEAWDRQRVPGEGMRGGTRDATGEEEEEEEGGGGVEIMLMAFSPFYFPIHFIDVMPFPFLAQTSPSSPSSSPSLTPSLFSIFSCISLSSPLPHSRLILHQQAIFLSLSTHQRCLLSLHCQKR
jgi:hypothetical protein